MPNWVVVGLASVVGAIYLRQNFLRPQARAVLAALREKFGIQIVPFYLLMDWLRQFMYAKGVVAGLRLYGNVELEPRSINGARIVDILDNQMSNGDQPKVE